MNRSRIGIVGPIVLIALSAVAYWAGVKPKLLGIAWIAFLAMAGTIPIGRRSTENSSVYGLVWGYGLASGAMITSAAVFLLPTAFDHDPQLGGVGVTAGIVVGYSAHTVGHRLTHLEAPLDDTAVRLTAHALAAGLVIGAVYAAMPDLGPLLGVAIVSHKAPAGFAAARRLAADGKPTSVLLVPASGVGITALPVAAFSIPGSAVSHALLFGFATGIFLHVAMDFLPRCEVGGEVYELASVEEHAHSLLDRLRLHAVISTALGALIVFFAWMALVGV